MAEQSHSSEASTSFLKSLSFLFILMQLLTLVLIGAFFKTGYFSVESNKQSLAFRNGRLLGEKGQQTFESGEAYWIWPQPIGSTISLPSRETFLSLDNKSFFYDDSEAEALTGADKRGEDDPYARLILGKHGYLISADSYIFHLKSSLYYSLDDAVDFYRAFHQQGFQKELAGEEKLMQDESKKLLQLLFDDAMLSTASRWKVDDILYLNPKGFRQDLEKEIKAKLQKLPLGLKIDRIALSPEDSRAPRLVQGTFAQVLQERVRADEALNQALKEKEEIEAEALKEAQQILSDADVYKARMTATARYQSEKMKSFQKLLKGKDRTVLLNLYMDTLKEAVSSVDKKIIVHSKKEGKMQVRLLIDPEKEKKKGME